ncbi:hypothetical protein CYMTET_36720 [Cymbomonas tetramitiformis]|uniref:Uncharacterized protein n=1 Tax=Cymbomonas tetramitiformis TaxID=36881 RepID=A0AAE0CGN7_9CHLO|nr:hypothetical protein CYMTET_36720 [Cymbomonas tetramitiformis]
MFREEIFAFEILKTFSFYMSDGSRAATASVRAVLRGNGLAEPRSKEAAVQTEISAVHADLLTRGQVDKRNRNHPAFVPCNCCVTCQLWLPRDPPEGFVYPELKLQHYNGCSPAVKAVGRLMDLAQPSRPTTKPLMRAERHDMMLEFERLRDALEVLPEDLEDLTDDLVETGVLARRLGGGVKPSDEWSLGEGRWEEQRTMAMRHRRRVLAWAMGAVDLQRDIPGGSPVGSLRGGSSGGSRGDGGITAAQIERIVAKAMEASLRGREGAGGTDPPAGGGKPATSLREVAKGSVGKQQKWAWSECEKVITEIRVAAARQATDLARVKHRFGRNPAMQVEAYVFEEVVDRCTECERWACGLEDLPESEGVRVRHLGPYIELAVQRVAVMQKVLEGRPGVEPVEFGAAWLRQAA